MLLKLEAELKGTSIFGFRSGHYRQVLALCAVACKRNVPWLKDEHRASSPQGYHPASITEKWSHCMRAEAAHYTHLMAEVFPYT